MTIPPDPHLSLVRPVTARTPQGCEECLRRDSPWGHLRLCLTCGHVGCCNSSPMRHARGHAETAGHPIARSFEPGEDWRWCFVHEAMV
ncbi:UBP-type zinc finger domain-containing protein [Streptomyces sp. NBC_00841]|uniref:UBP-type zinc finger domain-containing protein n=1 Tax=unclassified Streptomyces TaxID=2593676 RepID=UPI00224F1180|nr:MULTISPECIES: UBP-type zinc finger domain-containing protein [unclassified Streptomyces]MCX4530437.1 UBP-type zinc finger domain-containing protein [Streptomyces sp. NBC_01669]WSA03798.1 UBP-type zinc finger domain-containing protein [Streptomyces sp. NBC_00841]